MGADLLATRRCRSLGEVLDEIVDDDLDGVGAIGANLPKRHGQGVACALADEGVTMSYKYRTVRVRGTELVGTIARKHGSAAEIYETSKDLSTSVVPVFFEATGEIRFFDRSVLEDVVAPAS